MRLFDADNTRAHPFAVADPVHHSWRRPLHDLSRFIDAQQPVYSTALAELEAGRKRSHWMWFIFPQLKGLGRSPMAQRYGLADLAEAEAYLADPVLGERLRACVTAVLDHADSSAHRIFGSRTI